MSDRLDAAIAELVAALREEITAGLARPAPAELLSIPDAAARAGIGRTMLYGLIAGGTVRSIKVGRRRLVPADELAALGREKAATAHPAVTAQEVARNGATTSPR